MGVPGASNRGVAPPPSVDYELFATDAFLRDFEAEVVDVDSDNRCVTLSRTAFYPGGGGQPHDLGELETTVAGDAGKLPVTKVARHGGKIWHWLDTPELPQPGAAAHGRLDWQRRHLLMRTHTAMHIVCGVVWNEFQVPVTGGGMEPGKGRLDFPLPELNAALGAKLEARINEEVAAARDIMVLFLPRSEADVDPALIRTAADLIPAEIDPLRVIDIVGLDVQADGGTHIANTASVGTVKVVGTEAKGRGNKRIKIRVLDDQPTS